MANLGVAKLDEVPEVAGDSLDSSPQLSEMTNLESDVTSGEEDSVSTMGAVNGPLSTVRRRNSIHLKTVDSGNLLHDRLEKNKFMEERIVTQKVEVSTKFVLRGSTPAHQKIKESPLSSDAIFRQVSAGIFLIFTVYLEDQYFEMLPAID